MQWNDTAVDYPRDRCIHQLFEQQVARTPDATAVVFEDTRLTYAELNARANQLAHHLITLGVGPDVLVGLCLERSLELVVGLLGILKAGGAYVPLDPGYPAPRLAFMLEDTQAPVLLTQHKLLGQLPPYAGRVLCLDRDPSLLAAQPDTDPPCRATAREPRLRHLHLRLHRQSQRRDDRVSHAQCGAIGLRSRLCALWSAGDVPASGSRRASISRPSSCGGRCSHGASRCSDAIPSGVPTARRIDRP